PRTHRLARLWIREEPPDLLREVPRVHRIREESIPPVLDDLPHTGDVRDDHRFPGRHRFERDDPKRLEAGNAREHEHVAGRVHLGKTVVRDPAQDTDAVRDAPGAGEASHRVEGWTPSADAR